MLVLMCKNIHTAEQAGACAESEPSLAPSATPLGRLTVDTTVLLGYVKQVSNTQMIAVLVASRLL